MAVKLNKFTGKIDFKKDSKSKIDKTLASLSDYLNGYAEDEAAKIIEDFTKATDIQTKEEKIQRDNFIHAYKDRTTVLSEISTNIKKMREDLIDEQENKTKIGKANWTNKTKELGGKAKEVSKEAKELAKSPLDWLKKQLFGNLLGSLVKKLLGALFKPIKWLLAGLFAAGKLGARLVLKGVKAAVVAGMKAGGWMFNKMKGAFGSLWQKYAAPRLASMATAIKNLGGNILDKGKNLFSKGKDMAGSALGKATNFIKGLGGKITGAIGDSKIGQAAISGFNKAKGIAGSAASKVVSMGKGAAAFMSDGIKKSWSILKDKVMSIGEKISAALGKKGGKTAGAAIAKKIPSILGKFASKFIPGVGWALLAYDVYSAAKKSDGAVSFAVNLIDGVTGGLLGMAIGGLVNDFDGDNLGAYVQNLVKGFDLGLNPDEMDVTKDIDVKSLDDQAKEIDNMVANTNNNFNDPQELEKLNGQLGNNPQKQKIINEYMRLQQEVQSGNLEPDEANGMFKDYMKDSLTENLSNNASNKVPETGEELANNSGENVEQVKVQDVNISSMDTSMAQQVQAGLITMEASMNLAAQTAATVASSIGQQFSSVFQQSQTNMAPNLGGGTVTVQG